MAEFTQLIAEIKRQLKVKGMTYRDVAVTLRISEPSVKRILSGRRLSVERLIQVCEPLGFTMSELLLQAAASVQQLRVLTAEQEAHLVSDERLLLAAVCALNHWTVADIVSTYRLTEAECVKQLLVLDRLGLIELLPDNRMRLRIARDFDWLPGGPILTFFMQWGTVDFLDSKFDEADATLSFAHGMLTDSARVEFQAELRRLRAKLAALHQESAAAPLGLKRGVGVLLAMREWEPRAFEKLRRSSNG